jgi:hypothetical protein
VTTKTRLMSSLDPTGWRGQEVRPGSSARGSAAGWEVTLSGPLWHHTATWPETARSRLHPTTLGPTGWRDSLRTNDARLQCAKVAGWTGTQLRWVDANVLCSAEPRRIVGSKICCIGRACSAAELYI